MERALVACSISSREFDALQTFLIWILWGNQPKQQCSMVVYNQRPKWSCTELQWSLLPSPYFHYETRPGDIAADHQCLDTGVNLCSTKQGCRCSCGVTSHLSATATFKLQGVRNCALGWLLSGDIVMLWRCFTDTTIFQFLLIWQSWAFCNVFCKTTPR